MLELSCSYWSNLRICFIFTSKCIKLSNCSPHNMLLFHKQELIFLLISYSLILLFSIQILLMSNEVWILEVFSPNPNKHAHMYAQRKRQRQRHCLSCLRATVDSSDLNKQAAHLQGTLTYSTPHLTPFHSSIARYLAMKQEIQAATSNNLLYIAPKRIHVLFLNNHFLFLKEYLR